MFIEAREIARVGSVRGRSSRWSVAQIQRARLIAAFIAAVEANDYRTLTVADVISRAHVSRKTFYDVFDNVDGCFSAVFDETVEHARELVREAYASQPGWRAGMRAALSSLLVAMEQERGLARMCVVESMVAGSPVLERRAELLAQAAAAIDRGRELATRRYEPPPLTAEALAGGLATLLHTRLLKQDPAPLTDLLGPMMSMIVAPFLGQRAAGTELRQPSPPPTVAPRARPKPQPQDPLAQLNMRLTYRTVLVLSALAERPGASNTDLALAAGIRDNGQISKLLMRLARLGLAVNRRPGRARTSLNEWHLTELGAQLQRVTARSTERRARGQPPAPSASASSAASSSWL